MVYTGIMSVNTEITNMAKKVVGRPPGRTRDRPFQMRVDDDFIAKIDNWRRQQPNLPNRTQAVRYFVETHPEIRRGEQALAGRKK